MPPLSSPAGCAPNIGSRTAAPYKRHNKERPNPGGGKPTSCWKQRRLQAARYPRLHSGLPRMLETLEALGRARKEEAGGKVLWRG